MRQGAFVTKINGEVFLEEGGIRKEIEKEIKLGVNKKYSIETKKDSYCYITHKTTPDSKQEGFLSLLFFDSKVNVLTGRGSIKELRKKWLKKLIIMDLLII